MQAEDALSEHFDGLLKNRVAAEVGWAAGYACTHTTPVDPLDPRLQVGLLIGKPSVGSRDIVLAVVPHPDAEEVR